MTVETNLWSIGETKAPLPPLVSGAPIIGSGLSLAKEPVRFLTGLYQKYGPVFRIRVFNQIVTVMAGLVRYKIYSLQGIKFFSKHHAFFFFYLSLSTSQ